MLTGRLQDDAPVLAFLREHGNDSDLYLYVLANYGQKDEPESPGLALAAIRGLRLSRDPLGLPLLRRVATNPSAQWEVRIDALSALADESRTTQVSVYLTALQAGGDCPFRDAVYQELWRMGQLGEEVQASLKEAREKETNPGLRASLAIELDALEHCRLDCADLGGYALRDPLMESA